MVTQAEKQRLWAEIQAEYPDFARGLQQAKKADDGFVAIDGYSKATSDWLMAAIREHNMDLYRLLKDRVLPDKEIIRKLFNARITVALDDLIPALVAANSDSEVGREKMQATG